MGQVLQCVSPIDGSVYAEREVLSCEAMFEVAGRAQAFHGACGPEDVFLSHDVTNDLIADNEFDFVNRADYPDAGFYWTG